MGKSVSVRIWLTRYWYPSLTYLSLTELEKSGKLGGMFANYKKNRSGQEEEEDDDDEDEGWSLVGEVFVGGIRGGSWGFKGIRDQGAMKEADERIK